MWLLAVVALSTCSLVASTKARTASSTCSPSSRAHALEEQEEEAVFIRGVNTMEEEEEEEEEAVFICGVNTNEEEEEEEEEEAVF